MKKYLLMLALLMFTFGLLAEDYYPGRVLVKLEPGVKRQEFSSILDGRKYELDRVIVRRLNIVSVKIIDSRISAVDALTDMRANPWVEKAQLDHKVTQRQTIPNDPNFTSLWNLHNTGQSGGTVDADIDAPEAWDITTGGVTALGDTIVVAVIDGGCDINHIDLIENLWTNRNEITGNGIDDDNNGYIDDIHGWDAYAHDGSVPSHNHGTHVCGIVGAQGNNNILVTGVNWNVKLMPIAGSSSLTSTALEAYGYALDQRFFYDSTGGQLGAFVVATNSSFGVDNADCNSDPYILWNDIYDAMGQLGILSAAATMNSNSNVDVTGDVPTGCASDYVIAVTNTTKYDTKNSGAAYGALSIDLGAPGSSVVSTVPGNNTSTMSGTSMASPHVAGAVGFLHAVMSQGFATYYLNNPGDGALMIKDFILDGTDSLASLNGITVSGGRLNLNNSALLVQLFMASDSLDPNPVTDLVADNSNWYEISLDWTDPVTLFGGDPISYYVVDVYRGGQLLHSVPQGMETYTDGFLLGGQVVDYELVTRVIDTDSTSTPVSISIAVEGDEFIPGDVNHDGNVNVTDVVRLLHFTLGYATPNVIDMQTSDLDHNGSLDVFDILILVDIILGRI
ncbi:MAG: S8 family serine peptidase [Candidatus Marinimicrobia bacterium]|nr:S8 family serine peptidase [Candidatus Neomarinimicrobiota bacterium]